MINNILFLGPSTSPLLKWLQHNENNLLWTENKITASFIVKHNIDFVISYGYRHIIVREILDLLPNRIINLHISLLPFNRGADPNFWSFIDNTPKGVSIHYVDEGIDTGKLLVQKEVVFDSKHITFSSTYNKLKRVIEDLFYKNWADIKALRVKAWEQNKGGTYHRSKDKLGYMYLLKDRGWDTKISTVINKINGNE
tara:strand:- start:182 stop:772 length:591 start_codon:yes stop_codon:yes gene_type:complete